MCFNNKYKYRTLHGVDNKKTKQVENKKQTFFKILYWVDFQFFIQK